MRFPLIIFMACFMAATSFAVPLPPAEEAALSSAELSRREELTPQKRTVLMQRLREQEAAGTATAAEPELQRQYIETLNALGYHDIAAEQYECMLRKNPHDSSLWRAMGEAWMRVGPFGSNRAFEALKMALALDADDNEACVLLARLLHREGLYEQAKQHYDEALSREPEHVRAGLGKAVLMARAGDINEASALFDAIGAAAQIYDVETRIMLRKALFTYERRGGWFEDNAPNHAAYARLLYRAGRITDAILAARRAVAHDAGDYSTWNFIAAMSMQIGNLENAEQAFGKSLAANADQPDVASARRQLINELTMRRQDKTP